ncbi:MAG: response regulator, partial [Anaerolineales bacterium]
MTRQDAPFFLSIIADSATRQELSELLAGTACRLELADTPEIGLMTAEAVLPDVILIDMDLPGNAALETCRRLRAIRSLKATPILLLCSREQCDLRAAGLSAGADDFLDKPFDGLELLARLRTITRLNTNRLLLADLTRFAWMVEHAPEGYLLLNQAGGIQYANESAHALLHLPDDPFGLPFMNVVERLYVPEPESAWQHWLEDPEPCFLIQPESPTARAAWLVLEALDSPLGVEHHRVVRLRDVTERMSIYHDMRRFHTVVAHKLRTPVSIMYTNLNLVTTRLNQLPPDEVKRFAAETMKGVYRLVSEIRDILTYIDAPLSLNYGDPLPLHSLPEMIQSIAASLKLDDVHLSLPPHLVTEKIALTSYATEMLLYELLEN